MPNFESEPNGGGFNAISKEYKSCHTIENYVRLRNERPDEQIEIATTGGIEFLFAFEDELRSHGLKPDIVLGLLDADLAVQADVSLLLLQKLIERSKLENSGETHVVSRKKSISDRLINYVIALTLDALSWNDELEITRELVVLIKYQLGALKSQYKADLETHTKKKNATFVAAQILASGKTPTYRSIGRAFGVQASTVMRWFPNGDFLPEAEKLLPMIRDLMPAMREFAEARRNGRGQTKKS